MQGYLLSTELKIQKPITQGIAGIAGDEPIILNGATYAGDLLQAVN